MFSPSQQPLASSPALGLKRASLQVNNAQHGILSVGRDHGLLATRAKVLGISGREVVSATPQEAGPLLAAQRFHIVVLGHTLTDGELAALANLARSKSSDVKLLLTYLDPRPSYIRNLVDQAVDSWAGPSALVSAIQDLLNPEASAKLEA